MICDTMNMAMPAVARRALNPEGGGGQDDIQGILFGDSVDGSMPWLWTRGQPTYVDLLNHTSGNE